MTTVRVAIVQSEPAAGIDESLHRTEALVREAARSGAALVAFPETWLPGYPAWLDVSRDVALWDHEPVKNTFARYANASVDVPGEGGRFLREVAARHRVTMVLGISERVALLGGLMNIESSKGSGTILQVEIPSPYPIVAS